MQRGLGAGATGAASGGAVPYSCTAGPRQPLPYASAREGRRGHALGWLWARLVV